LGPAGAEDEPLSPAQVEAVEKLVGDYIRENPEVVREAIQSLVAQQQAEEEERQRMNTRLLAKDLNHDPGSPVAGNEQGDVTLVEFFDYRCTYCKAVSARLRTLIEEDKNLRFVFKEFPILGKESALAARAALAAHQQGKYMDFHFALMTVRSGLTERVVMEVAERVGLDTDKLRSDMAVPEIDAVFKRNRELADQLGIKGTPAFVIGDKVIPGVVEITEIKALIEKEREG
jgi:protein-disulfide isomerase